MRHPICNSPDLSSIARTTDSSSTLDRAGVKPNGGFAGRVSKAGQSWQSDRTDRCDISPHSSLGVGFYYYVAYIILLPGSQ